MSRQLRQLGDEAQAAMEAGDLEHAEDIARQRLAIASTTNRDRFVGNALTTLAKILQLRGKYEEAQALLVKALPLVVADNGPDSIPAIRTLLNLTHVAQIQGRYAEANAYGKDALERASKVAPKSLDRLHALNLAASVQLSLHHNVDALALLDQAASLDVAADGLRTGALDYARAQTLHQRAACELGLQRLEAARTHFEESAALFSRIGSESFDSISVQQGLGMVDQALGRDDEAVRVWNANLEVARRALGPTHPFTARIEGILASGLAKQGARAKAEALHQHAMKVLITASAPEYLAYEARLYAQFLIEEGKLEDALAAELRALDAIDAEYAQTRGLEEGTREGFIDRYANYYVQTLQTLLTLDKDSPGRGFDRKALEVVSRTQSRVFTELMREADVSRFSSNPNYQSLRTRQRSAQERLAALRRERAASGDEPVEIVEAAESENTSEPSTARVVDSAIAARRAANASALERQIHEATQMLADVEDALWKEFPRYMELSQPRPVNLDQLQRQVLKPQEVLLIYYVLPQETLAFVLTTAEFHLVRLPIGRVALGDLVARIRSPEDDGDAGVGALSQLDPGVLYEGYQRLVEPVEAFLGTAPRIQIVGNGPLFTLPFEMLVTQWGPAEMHRFSETRAAKANALEEYGDLHYLGDRREFAYLPSLSALVSMRIYAKPPVNYQTELVSFADPLFDSGAGVILPGGTDGTFLQRNLRRRGGRFVIPPLPETAAEARGIAAIVGNPSRVYLKAEAQEHTVKTLDLRGVRYLHFATHGLLGGDFSGLEDALAEPTGSETLLLAPKPESHGEPALLMSLVGDLQGEDGLLTVHEIAQTLDLNAELVILSACNTAGEHDAAHSGEGFAGLTRAFAFAGAHGLVVSHWSVESMSTQDMMLGLFRELKSGESPSHGLAKARTALRSTYFEDGSTRIARAHPFFWAPFVYVGD
ncbi:MAG: CHAT domain-containing tetratricopeptide repeat protein [Burkholderiaceae bacterium]